MGFLLALCFVFTVVPVLSQSKDSLLKVQVTRGELIKPEIFNGGFIDIVNNGQVNASARLIRLFIGEPAKFCLPLSLYCGVSSNSFQSVQSVGWRSNDVLVTHFINPLSGLINVSVEGVWYIRKKRSGPTQAGLLYQVGERVLTGVRSGPITDPAAGRPYNFLNSFAACGFYCQTGAWEKGNAANLGICWLAWRYISCYSGAGQVKELLAGIETNGIYHGYSFGGGVEIGSVVNIKMLYYKYRKAPEVNYSFPIYQFSVNYSIKK